MPSYKHKRAPSLDMTSIGLRNASIPTPTYSSIFRSQDHSYMLHQMYESPEKDNASKRPRLSNARTGTTYVPTFAQEETPEVDEKAFPINSETHGASRPRDAGKSPFPFKWPSLPPRSKSQQQKRISIPWILALVFCMTLLWFISIALGAGLFSAVYSQPTTPTVQKIYLVINDQVLNVSMPPAAVPDTINVTMPLVGSVTTNTSPTTSASPTASVSGQPTATEALIAGPNRSQDPQDNTEKAQIETSKPRRREDSRPTGFITLART